MFGINPFEKPIELIMIARLLKLSGHTPKEVAELLGLNLSGEREEARGIGGKVPAIQTKINIEISKAHEIYRYNIPVKVILDGKDEEGPILLGRAGFFDKFIIIFNQKEEKIILKPNKQN